MERKLWKGQSRRRSFEKWKRKHKTWERERGGEHEYNRKLYEMKEEFKNGGIADGK